MRAAWIAVLAAGTGIAVAVAVGAGGQPPARVTPCWEYGRLYITGGTAVIETQTSICRVELPLAPPENLTVYRSSRGQFEKKWNPQLYAINVFGGDGWEIEPGAELRENQPYFVRRAR
ncbi:MAG: hypothetical protein ACREJO_14200 [Phycisphaerales bacterium]